MRMGLLSSGSLAQCQRVLLGFWSGFGLTTDFFVHSAAASACLSVSGQQDLLGFK